MTKAPATNGIRRRPTTAALGMRDMGLRRTEGLDTENTHSIRPAQRWCSRSGHLRPERILDKPAFPVLFEGRVSKHPGRDEHFVGGLEHPLEGRRIPLEQRA